MQGCYNAYLKSTETFVEDYRRLTDLAAGLGIRTFVGSSGRVFPADLKAAPLLRAPTR